MPLVGQPANASDAPPSLDPGQSLAAQPIDSSDFSTEEPSPITGDDAGQRGASVVAQPTLHGLGRRRGACACCDGAG